MQRHRRQSEEHGASSIEYALLASLIAIAILGAVFAAGLSLGDLYCSIAESLPYGSAGEC